MSNSLSDYVEPGDELLDPAVARLRQAMRKELADTAGHDSCAECGHVHSPDGCTGPPTPSDLWAGVSVAGCDCDQAGGDALMARNWEDVKHGVRLKRYADAVDGAFADLAPDRPSASDIAERVVPIADLELAQLKGKAEFLKRNVEAMGAELAETRQRLERVATLANDATSDLPDWVCNIIRLKLVGPTFAVPPQTRRARDVRSVSTPRKGESGE